MFPFPNTAANLNYTIHKFLSRQVLKIKQVSLVCQVKDNVYITSIITLDFKTLHLNDNTLPKGSCVLESF